MLLPIWESFIKSLEPQKSENPIIYSILKQLRPIELTEEKIVLSCDTHGMKMFVLKRLPTIKRHLAGFLQKKIEVDIIITPVKKTKESPLFKFEPAHEDVYKKAGLNGSYVFDSFAVSPTNQVAYSATRAVAEKPGRAYSPLFLWGGVGVGKTHLAQAVAHQILEKHPGKKVFYSPGDLFTNELIESIREKATSRFRKKYRHLDLLIIDDVQFIAGKNTVQEEFFHTFNAIVSLHGQIILTADRPPYEIKNLEDRLLSRFLGGLSVDVQQPDFELRTAILLIKAREKNIELDIEAAKIIAEQIIDSRALEGTLLSLYARVSHDKNSVGLEEVELFFQRKKERVFRKLGPQDILSVVCSYYNIKPSQLKGQSRATQIARPRQITMYLLRQELGLKLEDIAMLLKRKDHTTVIHGVSTVKRLTAKDSNFKGEVDQIINSLTPSTTHSL